MTNQAVVAASIGSPTSIPEIAEVDLTTGTVSEFTGLGLGFVNGIAVDSAGGIACTSTEIDFSLEFYNLATQTGFKVPLHNANNQLFSGGYVQFDPSQNADGFAHMVHDNQRGARGLAQPQQRLAQ